jgi:hypothetical protein
MAKNWMQELHIKHGALTARAKAAGVRMAPYMAAPHRSPTIKKEVALAKVFAKAHRK